MRPVPPLPPDDPPLDEFGLPDPLTCPGCGTVTARGETCKTCEKDAKRQRASWADSQHDTPAL